jgi:hypothetical protein
LKNITEEHYCPLSGSFPGEIQPRDCSEALAIKDAVIKSLADRVAGQSELLSKRAQREPEMQIVGADRAGWVLITQSDGCFAFGKADLNSAFKAATKLGAPPQSDWDSDQITLRVHNEPTLHAVNYLGHRFVLRRPKKC